MIRETLNNLPEDLGDTYQRILSKISQSSTKAHAAHKVLKWVACAKRPLLVDELKEAAAFGLEDVAWDLEKIFDEDLMLESCRGLVTRDEDDETVRFAHHTVYQYLTTARPNRVDEPFLIDIIEAEISAGQLCVNYLLFADFEAQLTKAESKPEPTGVFATGGPLRIPPSLGIRKPLVELPYRLYKSAADVGVGVDYSKYMRREFNLKDAIPQGLKDKYQFLRYAVEYWEPHTRFYPTWNDKIRRSVKHLVLDKKLAFEFRPWGPHQHFGPFGCTRCSKIDAPTKEYPGLPHSSLIHYAFAKDSPTLFMIAPSVDEHMKHEGQDALLAAYRHNAVGIVKTILQYKPVNISVGKMIDDAAKRGLTAMLECLLKYGNHRTPQPGTKTYHKMARNRQALHLAAAKGDISTLDRLCNSSMDLNVKDLLTGQSALTTATKNGHASAVRLLLEKGIEISIYGEWALHHAAQGGFGEITKALLEYGASPNSYDVEGETPLHKAAEQGHSDVVRLLLQHGAKPKQVARRRSGAVSETDTAFHIAAGCGHVDVLELLKPSYTSVDEPLTITGSTALHLAARQGRDSAVRWLVANGANVEIRNKSHYSSLDLAVQGNYGLIVSFLQKSVKTADDPPGKTEET